MTAPEILTHAEDALNRRLEQYKDAAKFSALIEKFGDRVQGIENMLSTVRLARRVADAEGVQLDKLGAIVGVKRPDNVQDYVYRVIILGQAAANSSDGTAEWIIVTYALMTQATNVRLEEVFPAEINLFSDGGLDENTTPYVQKYTQMALAGGVLLGEFGVDSGIAAFGFNENPSALGFGDLDDPDVGGELASLIS